MRDFRYLENVSTLELDREACIGCGLCPQLCPHGVLRMEEGGDEKKARIVDRDGCMECGACALNCPSGAVRVTPGVGCAAYIIVCWLKGKGVADSKFSVCC
jgi:ferredoxin